MSAASANVDSCRTHPLQSLVARAMQITGADGIAIALANGGQIVCEASAGYAPQVGSRLDITSKWSVRCMRERQPVSFSHSLDRGSYSVVLVPMLRAGSPIGFCAAFATRAEAFTPRHVRVLMKIAETTVRNIATSPSPSPNVVDVPNQAPKLSSEQLNQIEREIAAFAVAEKHRARVAVAAKSAVGALVLLFACWCIFPDRVQEWSGPILYKIDRSIHGVKAPRTQPVRSAESAHALAPTQYPGRQ